MWAQVALFAREGLEYVFAVTRREPRTRMMRGERQYRLQKERYRDKRLG